MILLASEWAWLKPTFSQPDRLWLLLLIPLAFVGYLLLAKLRKRKGVRFTNASLLGKLAPRQSEWVRHAAVLCSLLGLITLVIAFALPQAEDRKPRERATIVLTLDTSQSMGAKDVKPNRLDAAKAIALKYVDELPKGYNVAVVQLSGNPSMRVPPTTDRSLVRRAIEGLQLNDGTAIGEAISVSLDAVARAPKGGGQSAPPAAVVLLSDGSNQLGRNPIDVAKLAKAQKVPIYTVAYGSTDGYVDLDGKREQVAPDSAALREVAKLTGGDFFEAEDAAGLDRAYQRLHSEIGYESVMTEVTARWAGLGVVFGVLAALAAALTASRTV